MPLPFVNGLNSTWADKGSKRVRISQPSAGLEKRQCTLQLTFGPGQRVYRPAVIFRGSGIRVSAVERAAWHPGVDIYWQGCAWADSAFCNSWAGNTFRKGVCGASIEVPEKESILFADNLYGQTTDEFKRALSEKCNTLLWLLPPKCTDEVQPVDAGYGKLFKVYVGQALDKWLLDGDNVEKWESNKLTASDRRILITQRTGEAAKKIDSDSAYRKRLFEKTGLAMTADGSDDDLINLQGVERGTYSFMEVDTTPEPLEDVLPISPAPADEENPPGSSDEESESETDQVVNEEAVLDMDDDIADDETLLPFKVPDGYSLVSSAPAALTQNLVNQEILLRLGVGWFRGVITRKAQARTSHLYDFRVFLETDGSTRSMKLPLAKYSVDGAAAEGSWALLSRCADKDSSEDSESESESEFEDGEEDEEEEEESGGGGVGSTIEGSSGGKGSSLNDMSDVGPIRAGGRKRMRVESEEEEEEEESGEGGFGSVVRSRVRRGGWGVA